MRLGKKFKEGDNPPRGTWTISYWPNGNCSILDDIDIAYEYTYELLDFEIPPKPLEPEVGKWYVLRLGRNCDTCLRQYQGEGKPMLDFDKDWRGMPNDYEFLEEWAPVKK